MFYAQSTITFRSGQHGHVETDNWLLMPSQLWQLHQGVFDMCKLDLSDMWKLDLFDICKLDLSDPNLTLSTHANLTFLTCTNMTLLTFTKLTFLICTKLTFLTQTWPFWHMQTWPFCHVKILPFWRVQCGWGLVQGSAAWPFLTSQSTSALGLQSVTNTIKLSRVNKNKSHQHCVQFL